MSSRAHNAGTLTLQDLGIPSTDCVTLQDFLKAWDEHGGPVLFVGAGMTKYQARPLPSAPTDARFLDWSELTQGMREDLSGGDIDMMSKLPSDYLRLAQLHETFRQRIRLLDAVERALPVQHFEPGPAHLLLRRFPWRAVVTTNYDDLLERTFYQTRRLMKVVWDADLTRRRTVDTLLLIKMHGELEDRESIVLTEEDYRCYERKRPGVALKVKQLLMEHPTLFVGFSLNDPNVASIEGWIRDTIGEVQLPSISLVHGEPLPAEAEMWSRRGIRLVSLPKSVPLARLLEAMDGERRTDVTPSGSGYVAERVAQNELNQLLAPRAKDWTKKVAGLLEKYAMMSDSAELSSLVSDVFTGQFRELSSTEVREIYSQLSSSGRRSCLLTAHEKGMTKVQGVGGTVVDIESELLADKGISPEEVAGIRIRRSRRLDAQGDLAAARLELMLARELTLDQSTRGQVGLALRKVLLRIGDPSEISKELLDSPLAEDAFAYARRGADVLLCRSREGARSWYERARDVARTGDEKYSALMGLSATSDPEDWSRMGEIDRERTSILKEERPGSEQIFDLHDSAARHLLKGFNERSRLEYEPNLAVNDLRKAMELADDMGWPRCSSPNYTSVLDNLARDVVGLLLRTDASWQDIREGLQTIVERGILRTKELVSNELVGRVASEDSGPRWIRKFLCTHSDANHMNRSRSLLRSSFLALFPDQEIEDHIRISLVWDELQKYSFRETSPAESHALLISRSYTALPSAAAEYVLALASNILRDGALSHPRERTLELPLVWWFENKTILKTNKRVQELVTSLHETWNNELLSTDWIWRHAVLNSLRQLAECGALESTSLAQFIGHLDACMTLNVQKIDPMCAVEFVIARSQLGSWNPSEEVCHTVVSHYDEMKQSTGAGTWMDAVVRLGADVAKNQRERLSSIIVDYASSALQANESALGSSRAEPTAARGVHFATKFGILSPEQGQNLLLDLTKKDIACAPWTLNLPGLEAAASEAETMLTTAMARNEDAEGIAHFWCHELVTGRRVSNGLEGLLIGRLFDSRPGVRQDTYWATAQLMSKNSISDSAMDMVKSAIVKFGVADKALKPRCAALGAMREYRDQFNPEDIERISAEALADDVAWVRRLGEGISQHTVPLP